MIIDSDLNIHIQLTPVAVLWAGAALADCLVTGVTPPGPGAAVSLAAEAEEADEGDVLPPGPWLLLLLCLLMTVADLVGETAPPPSPAL